MIFRIGKTAFEILKSDEKMMKKTNKYILYIDEFGFNTFMNELREKGNFYLSRMGDEFYQYDENIIIKIKK